MPARKSTAPTITSGNTFDVRAPDGEQNSIFASPLRPGPSLTLRDDMTADRDPKTARGCLHWRPTLFLSFRAAKTARNLGGGFVLAAWSPRGARFAALLPADRRFPRIQTRLERLATKAS